MPYRCGAKEGHDLAALRMHIQAGRASIEAVSCDRSMEPRRTSRSCIGPTAHRGSYNEPEGIDNGARSKRMDLTGQLSNLSESLRDLLAAA
jgi:hypothetical protein